MILHQVSHISPYLELGLCTHCSTRVSVSKRISAYFFCWWLVVALEPPRGPSQCGV
jgi:hypothetical protein